MTGEAGSGHGLARAHPALRVFALYAADLWRLVALAALVWVPAALAQLAMELAFGHRDPSAWPGGLVALLEHSPPGILATQGQGLPPTPTLPDAAHFVLALFTWFAAGAFASGAAILVTTARIHGSPVNPLTALGWVLRRWWGALSARSRLLAMGCLSYALAATAVSVTFIFFVFATRWLERVPAGTVWPWNLLLLMSVSLLGPPVAAVVVVARHVLAPAVVLVEGVPGPMAMERSGQLLYRRRRLALAVIGLPVSLIVVADGLIYLLSPLIELTKPSAGMRLLWFVGPGLLVTILLVPLVGVAQAVLYAEAKERADATDALSSAQLSELDFSPPSPIGDVRPPRGSPIG